jgi:hypothetical protein
MIKRIGSIIVVLAFLLAAVGLVLAAAEKGNSRKGKYTYRKNCRTCHIDGGSAKELGPIAKTQAQWDEVFKKADKLACKAEWGKVSAEDKTDIYAYLWGHASDSPDPVKCE